VSSCSSTRAVCTTSIATTAGCSFWGQAGPGPTSTRTVAACSHDCSKRTDASRPLIRALLSNAPEDGSKELEQAQRKLQELIDQSHLTWVKTTAHAFAEAEEAPSFVEVMREHVRTPVTLVTRDINLQNKSEYAGLPFDARLRSAWRPASVVSPQLGATLAVTLIRSARPR